MPQTSLAAANLATSPLTNWRMHNAINVRTSSTACDSSQCGLAETSQPDRDLPFRARQYPGSVDPVVGVLMVDHRLLPQLTDQGNLLLLPLAAAAKMSGHFETVVFHPVPADPDAEAKPAI